MGRGSDFGKNGSKVYAFCDYIKESVQNEADLCEMRYCKDSIEEYFNLEIKLALYDCDGGVIIYIFKFYNVSVLKVKNIYDTLYISDIEIQDNIDNGYTGETRYYLTDFEDDKISFYFEKLEISTKN